MAVRLSLRLSTHQRDFDSSVKFLGIVASMAFDPVRDVGLKRLDASHLFEANTTRIAVRRGHYLRGYAYRFLQDCSPALTPEVVKAALDAE